MRRKLLFFCIFFVLTAPWTLQLPKILQKMSWEIKPVFLLAESEIAEINTYQGLVKAPAAKIINKISWNKASFVGDKFLKSFFLFLDPNYYFFREHPRERAGVETVAKFVSVSFIFFLFGLSSFFKKEKEWKKLSLSLFSYLGLISFLGLPDTFSYPSLFFISYIMAFGATELFDKKRSVFLILLAIYFFQFIYWTFSNV